MTRRRAAALLLTAAALWAGAALTLDRLGRAAPPPGPYDAILVAGCRVTPDGQASLPLRERVTLAAALYHQGYADRLVLTGGLGDYPPSEAQAAAAVALDLGVPAEAMILEDRSTSTEENARFAAETTQATRVLLVSDAYHLPRARRVFARHFAEVQGAGAISPASYRLRGALREVLAVGWYAVNGRLSVPDTAP